MRNNSQIYNSEGDDEHRHSVNALSENNENPLQEMKRKNYSPVSMRLQVKRVPSAVAFFRAFYRVTTVRA